MYKVSDPRRHLVIVLTVGIYNPFFMILHKIHTPFSNYLCNINVFITS